MEVQKVFHVTEGEGDTSYVTNSATQKAIIMRAKPHLEDTIIQLYSKTIPKCLTVVDMGCSSGPNSLLVISQIIDTVDRRRQKLGHPSPEFQVFLNDLPGNDFNTIFKSTPNFYEKLRKNKGDDFGPCFVAGVAGSFYGRLFPSRTLNLVHSSNAQHWLSQVPQGIENNKGNIYIATTSPPNVYKAYVEQFNKDFSVFLSSRSKEMVVGGCIIITMIGRSTSDPSNKQYCEYWDMVAKAFRDMVSQGLIEEAKLDSFNVPYYTPHAEEVRSVIQSEGSFDLDQLDKFDIDWVSSDDNIDNLKRGKIVAKTLRAVIESMVASHFGESIMDNLFSKHAEHVAEFMKKQSPKLHNLVICMTKNNKI